MIGAITIVVEPEKMLELKKLPLETLAPPPQAQRHPAAMMANALAAIYRSRSRKRHRFAPNKILPLLAAKQPSRVNQASAMGLTTLSKQ
jgi:hypothetical protein